jgi:hypothetical protein
MATMGIRQLRLKAREVGVQNFRGMNERELRSAIADATNGSGTKTARKAVVKKAAVKKAPAKRTAQKPKTRTAKAAPATPKRGPGRPPKNATAPKRGPGRPPKAKPAPAPRAKRQATAPRATSSRRQAQRITEPTGRHVLNGVDYSVEHEDWNPRANSITGQIFKLLRKYRGNRDKVYDALEPRISELFGSKKRTGTKWEKGEREQMLAYRIARTAWDFAVKTEQHEIAEDRVEYGTGGTGSGVFKRKVVKATVKAPKATPAKRGRPPKAQAAKPAVARTGARRGRPPKAQAGRRR